MDAVDGPEPFGPLMTALRGRARAEGPWNLFLARTPTTSAGPWCPTCT